MFVLTLGVNVVVVLKLPPNVSFVAVLTVKVPRAEGVVSSVDAVERIVVDENKRLPVVSLVVTWDVEGKRAEYVKSVIRVARVRSDWALKKV